MSITPVLHQQGGHPYIITLLPIILPIISIIYSILSHKKYDYWASFPANSTMYIILFNHVKGQIVKIGQNYIASYGFYY